MEINLIVGQDVCVGTVIALYEEGFTFDVNDGKISEVRW